jgi:hypothetical protein
MGVRLPIAPHSFEIFGPGQAKLALHPTLPSPLPAGG